jgi:hypothetical protein
MEIAILRNMGRASGRSRGRWACHATRCAVPGRRRGGDSSLGEMRATRIPISLVSLYLSSKPAWFGSIAWLALGPDLSTRGRYHPAIVRYEGGKMP